MKTNTKYNLIVYFAVVLIASACGVAKSGNTSLEKATVMEATKPVASKQVPPAKKPAEIITASVEESAVETSQVFIAPAPQMSFKSPVPMPFSTKFIPKFDIPCGGPLGTYAPGSEAWNHQCVAIAKRTEICQPLTDDCAKMEPLLRRADADKRTKWAKKCYNTFQSAIANIQIGEGTANPNGVHCPLYPIMGWLDGENKEHVWTAPTDENADCVRPINVFPIRFCSTHLK